MDLIVTNLALLKPTGRGTLELLELAPDVTVQDVIERTTAAIEVNRRHTAK